MREVVFVLGLLLVCDTVRAQPSSPSSASTTADPAEQELLQVLQEETAIATRSKMNADYVPGSVSVFHGEELERLGFRSVWESLSLVPGVDSTINNFGNPLAVVRGVGYDVLTSHIKFMVDSIPVNLSFTGANHAAMLMPVEQVERIEVIRGPGSALYGEFAFSGVINVITRKEGNRVYAAGGSHGSARAGAHFTHDVPNENMRVVASASVWATDGADTFVAEDSIRRLQPAVSLTPGNAAEDEKHRSQFLTVDKDDFKLSYQRQRRNSGLYFGTRSLPPDPDARENDEGYVLLDARQSWDLSDTVRSEARLTFNEGDRLFSEQTFPPGFIQRFPPPRPAILLPGGQQFYSYHQERRLDAGVDVSWKASDKHDLLLRLNQADVEVTDTYQISNVALSTGLPINQFRLLGPGEATTVRPGAGREIFSAALQDQIQVSDTFTATLGLRLDDYSDVGRSVTPRIAAVWQAGGPHILKAQYGEAFRPPTLQSLNLPPVTATSAQGNPNLRPETIQTTELGYVYREAEFTGRATVFKSTITDFIGQGERRQVNVTDFDFEGAELEADWRFDEDWRAIGNLAFVDASDTRGPREIEGLPERLANLAVMRNFGKDTVLAARVRDVGERTRNGTFDRRPPTKDYTTVDLTLSLFHILDREGLSLRLGAKNIFDADVRAPAGPNTYLDDLPRPGTTVWAQLSYAF